MQTSQSAQVRRPWLLRKPSCACSRDRHAPHVSPSGTRAHTRCSSWNRRNSPGRSRPTPAPSCRHAPPSRCTSRTKCSAVIFAAHAASGGAPIACRRASSSGPRSSQDGLDWRALRSSTVSRLIGSPEDPDNLNPVVGALELRWRASRGYLGGGVRYYHDEQPNRDHVRFVFVAGEELPSFRGRPIWLLFDVRLEEPQKNFLQGLRPSFGIRFDLWGSRP